MSPKSAEVYFLPEYSQFSLLRTPSGRPLSKIARFRTVIPGFIFSHTSIDGDLNFIRNSGVSARRELTVLSLVELGVV